MVKSFRILVVDDQPRARASLRALLATRFPLAAFDEAPDGAEAIRRVEAAKPQVVLMDVVMPELNGVEAARRIKTRWPEVKVIVLSMYGEYRAAALAAGSDVFVSKDEPPENLLMLLANTIGPDSDTPDPDCPEILASGEEGE